MTLTKEEAMRSTAALFLVVLLAATAVAGRAGADPAGLSYYIRGSMGISSQKPAELNDMINTTDTSFQSKRVPFSLHRFKQAPSADLEVGVRFSPRVSAGLGVSFQTNGINNIFAHPDYPAQLIVDRMVLSLTEVTGNVTYWMPAFKAPLVPRASGLFAGVRAGMAYGALEENVSFSDAFDPSRDYETVLLSDQSGFAGGVFGGWEHAFGDLKAFARFGYNVRKIKLDKLDFVLDERKPEFGYLRLKTEVRGKREIDANLGGGCASIGVGLGFGGR
jgi:hypothetical protein